MVSEGTSVVVAMSGGVDSSAAAAALVDEGYRVAGVTFRMWEDDRGSGAVPAARCSTAMVEEAARAARVLDIEHVVIDLRERFHALIVEPFVREYLRGRTPNPCVECNRLVKFPTLVEVADELGAGAVATGHYARTCLDDAGYHTLLRASHTSKDQSYVLYGLGRERLSRCLFPNGERYKEEVRKTALAHGLAGDERGESQEICFLCGGSYRDFISRGYPEAMAPGPVLDTAGAKLGEHRGIAFHTIGQRRGLGISAPCPLYVVALDPSRQAVILGRKEEVPGKWLRAASPHWVKGEPPGDSFAAEAMVRYNTVPEPCRVEVSDDGCEIFFARRVWALTPGQHAVLYRGDEVLGGGVIDSVG
ncbi:MAG: tRNA 2-thiouridine(34) synthase MnmA [Actinobacteria bacterium]|nr:tRNA 2-thiouridine(34) synthase MnmA [Actinomycetota bacterium]